MKKFIALGSLSLFAASLLIGCGGGAPRKKVIVRSKPRPHKKVVVVKPGPKAGPAKVVYVKGTPHKGAVLVKVVPVRTPGPAMARPAQPGPNYIWMPGRWFVNGGKYYWAKGKWRKVKPWMIEKGYYWKKGHWAQAPDGHYFFVKGQWATR